MKRIALLLVFWASALSQAWALEPSRREAIVLNGRVWEGSVYKENLLPSNMTEFRLIGGKDSALSFVRTQEYYWPLSRQVYVDFEKERQELDGVLKVEQSGKIVSEIKRSTYSILYPEGAINGNGSLLWGDDATAGYQEYTEGEKDFAKRFVEAQQANTQYEQALLKAGAARKPGENVGPITPPPPLPEPNLRLVTKPVPGFRVDLPAGDYQISLVSDGKPVFATSRTLRVIDIEGRKTIAADIVPEERWTQPLASNSAAARLFVRPGTTFYVTLFDADRYDEAEYLPVITPQSKPVPGRNMWVRRKPSENTTIEISWSDNAGPLTSKLLRLKVEQTEGSGYGYKVRAAAENEKEDLKAFLIAVPEDETITGGRVQNSESQELAFSREVVIVHPRNAYAGFGLAVVPIFLWGILAIFGRRTVKRPLG